LALEVAFALHAVRSSVTDEVPLGCRDALCGNALAAQNIAATISQSD